MAHGIYYCPNFCFIYLSNQRLCIVRSKCLHVHTPDCVEIIYELQLLPNNIDTFLHKSGAVQSVYVSLGRRSGGDGSNTCHWTKRFIPLKQEVAATAATSTFSSLLHSLRRLQGL